MSDNIIPVILCGGIGSRLWPLSRQSFPKQFWPLISKSNNSLLQNTYKRIKNIPNLRNPLIVTNERYKYLVSQQMHELNVKDFEIILEPEGRDTAPAIALAALYSISKIKKNPKLIVFSADHYIRDDYKFELIIKRSLKELEAKRIYTFGIFPDKPVTEYGYIEIDKAEVNNHFSTTKVNKFVEKPTKLDAEKYLESGNYLWNSGIFLFSAEFIIDQLKIFSPEILKNCQDSLNPIQRDNCFIRPYAEIFLKCPNVSIDIAVLEKSNSVFVIPLDVGWSDIGDWNKLWESSPKDKNNNAIKGNIILKESKNSYIFSQNKLILGIGLSDLIIVDSDDSLLVMNKFKTNLFKPIINNLKKIRLKELFFHNKEYRPWGSYKTINSGERWLVKEIVVKPGEKLSLQSHLHRSEHWIVVNGTALVEIDNEAKLVNENESIYIPLGSKHRLSNPGDININLIEVQTGTFLREDDIIRYEDNYERDFKSN